MEKTVTASYAHRKFGRILASVRKGNTYVVTCHGDAVAKIAPIGEHEKFAARAREVLFARLESQPVVDVRPWTRDELYERNR